MNLVVDVIILFSFYRIYVELFNYYYKHFLCAGYEILKRCNYKAAEYV